MPIKDSKYANWLVSTRLGVVAVSLLMVGVFSIGLPNLQLDAKYTAYFNPSDPLLPAHHELQKTFSLHDNVLVILATQNQEAISRDTLNLVQQLSQSIRELEYVIRVDSITDNTELSSRGLDLTPSKLTQRTSGNPLSNNIEENSNALISVPILLNGLLLSNNRRVVGINVSYDMPDTQKPIELMQEMAKLRSTVNEIFTPETTQLTAHYSGTIALNEAYIEVVQHDLRRFVPGILVTFLLMLSVLFRSWKTALAVLFIALLSTSSAFGIAGWFNLPLASIHTFVPIIIMTISIAGSVHIVSSFANTMSSEDHNDRALNASIAQNLLPLSLSCFSTALGFLTLLLSPSPPVQRVGIIVALGVCISWLMNLSILPLLIRQITGADRSIDRPSFGLSGLVARLIYWRKFIVAGFLMIGVASLFDVKQIQINDNVFEYFNHDSEFRQATKVAQEHLSGVHELSYQIIADSSHSALEVTYLSRIAEMTKWLESQPEVKFVRSLNTLKNVKSRQLPIDDVALLANWLSEDGQSSRIAVYLKELDANQLIAFDDRAKLKLSRLAQSDAVRGGVGPTLLFAHLGQRNAKSMFMSLSVALMFISIVIGVMSRSGRILVIALVCNIWPVVVVYAGWAMSGGYITLGSAMVMGMILGIVVDDTIFLLNRFSKLEAQGINNPSAIDQAVVQIGPALVITTLTLCLGLSIGLLSSFLPIYTMALLSVLIIALALATDMLLLPMLLLRRIGRSDVGKPQQHDQSTQAYVVSHE